MFKVKDDEKIYILQKYWIPEDLVEKRIKEDGVPYDKWHKKGLIDYCQGNRIDHRDVANWFRYVQSELDIYMFKVGYDSWSANYLIQDIKDTFGEEVIEPVIQGKKTLSSPMKSLAADLKSGKIVYGDNPILEWCISNVKADRDKNDNIQPVKTSNPKQRIDGFASLLDAYVAYEKYYDDYCGIL